MGLFGIVHVLDICSLSTGANGVVLFRLQHTFKDLTRAAAITGSIWPIHTVAFSLSREKGNSQSSKSAPAMVRGSAMTMPNIQGTALTARLKKTQWLYGDATV